MKLFNEKIFNPYWVVGFVDGEGCFSVGVFKNKTLRLGYQVQLEFSITQHKRDHDLLLQFIEFFGCGYVAPDPVHRDGACVPRGLGLLNLSI